MISEQKTRSIQRNRRAKRVRNAFAFAKHPRMTVYRSNKQLFVQIIDDRNHKTIVSKGTLAKDLLQLKTKKERSKELGKQVAKLALDHNVTSVVFDRGRYKYHGHVALVAEGAREAGLQL